MFFAFVWLSWEKISRNYGSRCHLYWGHTLDGEAYGCAESEGEEDGGCGVGEDRRGEGQRRDVGCHRRITEEAVSRCLGAVCSTTISGEKTRSWLDLSAQAVG